MKAILRALSVVLCLIVLPACWNDKQEKKNGFVLVNVLDKELYDDCRIKGSINIPFEMIETMADKMIDKNAQVVFYCSNYQCTSSEFAARKLKEKGFANVAVYEGGMAEWFQQGFPVEGLCQQPYLRKNSKPAPLESESDIPVMSVDELANTMGMVKEKKGAA